MRTLILCCLMALPMLLSAQNVSTPTTQVPVDTTLKLPSYPAGEKALLQLIDQKVTMPADFNWQGKQEMTINLKFVVLADGTKSQVALVSGNYPVFKAVSEVLDGIAKWTPGTKGGKPENMYYNLKVTVRRK